MAGLFDTFTRDQSTDPAVVAKAIREQQQEQFSKIVAAAPNEKTQAAGSIVQGLSTLAGLGVFGEKFKGKEDPRLTAVKKDAELAAQITKIEGDPSSADFAMKAAEAALAAGREDLAIKYREAGGLRAKAEAKAAAAVQAAAVEEGRKQFSALPTSAQEEMIATKPDFLVTALGVDPAEAATISKNVAERNAFQKAKLQKNLNDVRAATTTKTTNADVEQIKSTLSMFGISDGSFGFGDNAEEFDNFATPIAAEVQRRMDMAKDKGERLNRNKVAGEVFQELQDSGAIVLRDRWFGEGKVIEDIDPTKFRNAFTSGATGPVIDLTQP